MTQSSSKNFWRSASVATALALCLVPTASQAEDVDELADKIDRIERDLRDLQYVVHKGNPPPESGGLAGGPPGGVGAGGARLGDVENSLRDLRGQVETLTFQVRQLTEQLDLARKESNYRLGALEGGAPAGAFATSPGGAASAPATTPPAAARPAPAVGGPAVSPQPKPSGSYGAPIKLTPGTGSDAQGRPAGTLGSVPADALPEGAAGGLSPRQQYDSAMELLSRAQYAEAQSAFRGFIAANPADELAGPAQYWVGDISFTQKDYAGAAKSFADLLKRYAKTPRAPDAMLKLGLSLMELGQKKEGCTTLGAIKSKYPNANKAILDRAAKRATEAQCK
jgi:tol-pal system protein YbgF